MSADIEKAKETGEIGTLDPMTDSPLKNPITPEDIAKRLEGEDTGNEVRNHGDNPEGDVPPPIDISQFSPETLQALKRMLNATPDRPQRKSNGMTIELREIEGNIIKDFGRAYNGYINDPEEPTRKIAVPKIKVWVFGQNEPIDMQYADFMQAERREFKVISSRVETKEVEEGETVSNESGKLVTMIATYQKHFFMIELPNGERVEISDKVANA